MIQCMCRIKLHVFCTSLITPLRYTLNRSIDTPYPQHHHTPGLPKLRKAHFCEQAPAIHFHVPHICVRLITRQGCQRTRHGTTQSPLSTQTHIISSNSQKPHYVSLLSRLPVITAFTVRESGAVTIGSPSPTHRTRTRTRHCPSPAHIYYMHPT